MMGETDEVYKGNKPACKGQERENGGFNQYWSCKYGGGETYKEKIEYATFSINTKISIFICNDYLWIIDFRYSSSPDVWEYQNRPIGSPFEGKKTLHDLEPEKIEKILNTKIPDCKLWDMVQARAKELYYNKKV